jgi:hypothetical protein
MSLVSAAVIDVTLAPISQGSFLVLVHDTPYFALEVMRSPAAREPDAGHRGLSEPTRPPGRPSARWTMMCLVTVLCEERR